MLEIIRLFIGHIFIISGLVIVGCGVFGLFKFKKFFNKLHAAGVIEACGVPICLIGIAIINYDMMIKYILIAVVIFIVSPVVTYNLIRAKNNYDQIIVNNNNLKNK